MNYPLSTPGPQLKRFKAGLCEFVRVLVRSCRNSLVYDEFLFPSLLALLTGLSDSQVRAFRHTSTLLGKAVNMCKNFKVYECFGKAPSSCKTFVFLFSAPAVKLMTALVDLAVAVSVQLQTTQRRCDIENSRIPPERASDRLEELKATIREVTPRGHTNAKPSNGPGPDDMMVGDCEEFKDTA